jgi:lipopolysaccharide biosynthesis regulator YciM
MSSEQDARKQVEMGNHLVVEEDLDGALEAYTKAIALDAKCVDALVNRAAVRLKCGEAAGALVDSQAALDIDGSNVGALRRKG